MKSLLPSSSHILKALNRWSSNGSSLLEHAHFINPEMTEFLQSTKGFKNSSTSLWSLIREYGNKNHFSEKSVLLNPKVADAISETICNHTLRGNDLGGTFIDLNAGVGLLSKSMYDRQFFDTIIVAEDKCHEGVLKTFSEVSSKQSHKVLLCRKNLLITNVFNKFLSSNVLTPGSWFERKPSFTVAGITSHQFLKTLAINALHIHDKLNTDNMFFYGRHEFFFIVNHRTWSHIAALPTPKTQALRLPLNVLFQFVFDFQCIMALPTLDFIPWKNHFNKNDFNLRKYPLIESHFFLVHARPKKFIHGLNSIQSLKYFITFLRLLLAQKMKPVLDVLLVYIPSIGGPLSEICDPHQITCSLSNEQILLIFELCISNQGFNQIMTSENCIYNDTPSQELNNRYIAKRKEYCSHGQFNWSE